MKKFNRFCSILLSFAMLLPLTACSESAIENPSNDTQTSNSETTDVSTENESDEAVEFTRNNYPDTLPERLDFEGANYRILTDEDAQYSLNEMVVDEYNGEAVNDALYDRMMTVNDRMNVVISKELQIDPPTTIRTCVKAGTDFSEVVAGYAYYTAQLAIESNFFNLAKFPYIDYDMPWWPQSLTDTLMINDKLFFITGDISLKLLQFMYCIFYNKQVADDYGINNLYELVTDNKWTVDKYIELASIVSKDIDGNQVYDMNDAFGTVNNVYCDVNNAAFDCPISQWNDEGELELIVMSERFVNVYQKLFDFYKTNNVYTSYNPGGPLAQDQEHLSMFASNQLLFYPFLVHAIQDVKMRDMEADYGILVYPKYDEYQENYATISHNNYSLMCVPVTVQPKSFEMIGAVTEALAAESYRNVTYAYFDVVLKNKLARDPESGYMLDLLVANLKFDPAEIYGGNLSDIGVIMRELYNGTPDIASWFAKRQKVYKKSFENFNKKFAEIPSELPEY